MDSEEFGCPVCGEDMAGPHRRVEGRARPADGSAVELELGHGERMRIYADRFGVSFTWPLAGCLEAGLGAVGCRSGRGRGARALAAALAELGGELGR